MKLSIKSVPAYASAVALGLALAISSSLAQSEQPAEPGVPEYKTAPGAPNPQLIDDATLQHTAKAFVKVSQIVRSSKNTLDSARGETAKMKAAQQVESQKVAAVKSEGLEPQKYNQVLQLVQTDSNLQQKFLSYVNNGARSPTNTM